LCLLHFLPTFPFGHLCFFLLLRKSFLLLLLHFLANLLTFLNLLPRKLLTFLKCKRSLKQRLPLLHFLPFFPLWHFLCKILLLKTLLQRRPLLPFAQRLWCLLKTAFLALHLLCLLILLTCLLNLKQRFAILHFLPAFPFAHFLNLKAFLFAHLHFLPFLPFKHFGFLESFLLLLHFLAILKALLWCLARKILRTTFLDL